MATSLRIQPSGHAYNLSARAISDPTNIGDGGPASETTYGDGEEFFGIAFDAEGNLFSTNHTLLRIRAIRFGAVLAEPGSGVTASEGTEQSVPVRRVFAKKLVATVRSPAGTLENGIRVEFVAPASGPSCIFPSGTTNDSVLTDRDGRAAATCTAATSCRSTLTQREPKFRICEAQRAMERELLMRNPSHSPNFCRLALRVVSQPEANGMMQANRGRLDES